MIEVSSPPEDASTMFSGMSAPHWQPHRAAQQQIKDSLLHVQSVLGLLKNNRAFRIHDLVSDFLATMSRQTMHECRIRTSRCHQFPIDLVRRENLGPEISLVLLPHARPRVG